MGFYLKMATSKSRVRALFAAPALMFAGIGLVGCGYSTASRNTRIENAVHTLAVPAFVNQTHTYHIEQAVTAAVVRELNSRTRFHVVQSESADADATLHGFVTSTQISPLTYDSQTGRASSALVTVEMKVSLVDRSGKVIFDDPNYVFREQYQVSREISSFFEEESPAVERLSRDMARTLVAEIEEGY